MTKLDARSTSLAYPADPYPELATASRLIILVPSQLDFSAAARRIWELTHTTGMHIQLLGLSRSGAEESRLRRDLITMASLLEAGRICAEVKVEVSSNWMDAVSGIYKTGDAIVCFAEQRNNKYFMCSRFC